MDSYLITGGSRSGKSRHALALAKSARAPFYIATGWAGDEEMADRIEKHRKERGPHWTTIEERFELAEALLSARKQRADFIVVDCLTLWVSNMLFGKKDEFENKFQKLIATIPLIEAPLVFVSNEVGSGIVPGDPVSREFRDLAGFVNQRIAATVKNVVLTVAGIPLKIKSQ